MYKHIPTFGQAFNIQSIAAANLLFSSPSLFIYYSLVIFWLFLGYIFWVGVGPICRLFFYQFTGVGQSANTLCTVTYTHFVHIIGLPLHPFSRTQMGPFWLQFTSNDGQKKIRKKLKKLKGKEERKKTRVVAFPCRQ
jgi:hypothetical protein